jgi:hypothetical protein
MSIYLLPILPVILLSLMSREITRGQLLCLWLAMVGPMAWLMPEGSRDYTIYLRDFGDINNAGFFDVVGQDPLYASTVWLFGHAGGSGPAFYFLLSSAGLLVKLTAMWRLSAGRTVVLLTYACSYFFLHEFTQIRAGLAIGIWMLALSHIDTNRKHYYVLVLLASLIHVQAALGFLPPLLMRLVENRRRTLIMSAIVLAIVATAATRLFDQMGYAVLASIPDPRTAIYVAMAEEDVWVRPNPYSFISLFSLATALFGLNRVLPPVRPVLAAVPSQRVQAAIFCSMLLGCCALAMLSSISVAAFRVSEHFFALLPLGAWFVVTRSGTSLSNEKYLLPLAVLLSYIFVFYGSFLLNPVTGAPNE